MFEHDTMRQWWTCNPRTGSVLFGLTPRIGMDQYHLQCLVFLKTRTNLLMGTWYFNIQRHKYLAVCSECWRKLFTDVIFKSRPKTRLIWLSSSRFRCVFWKGVVCPCVMWLDKIKMSVGQKRERIDNTLLISYWLAHCLSLLDMRISFCPE